ncbi:MAG: hypothetical protein AMJ46_07810 [Latescibacteria bacterium DG_63]|nr:MAG: hypothetical protein AMJ46_07810 [Latescibacteria bacterium DG_63]
MRYARWWLCIAVTIGILMLAAEGHSVPDSTEVYEFVFWFGGQGPDPGEFNGPNGMGSDWRGNLYVCDSGNHRVQKFDNLGNFLMMFGEEGAEPGQFIWAVDVAVDEEGFIYVCDYDRYEGDSSWVQKFDSLGNFVLRWGGADSHEPGDLDWPQGIAIGDSQYVFVGDLGYRIQRFTPDGEFDALWTHPDTTAHGGRSVATYPGSVYTTWATGEDYVFRHDPVGNIILSFGGGGLVDFVSDLATDSHGNLYCGDWWQRRISKFDSLGNFVTMWGSGGPQPWPSLDIAGIAVDAHDAVYVSDFTQDRVAKYRRTVVSVKDEPQGSLELHTPFQLRQNCPNPFSAQTVISYAIGGAASERSPAETYEGGVVNVHLAVYNLLGQQVRTLLHERQGPGEYSVVWDGRSDDGRRVASGIYTYQLQVDDQVVRRRSVLIR